MGLKCKLKTENGKRVVKNQDGTNNQLFQDLLKVAKDNNEALKMWASSYLPEFQSVTGKTAEQATAEDVINFLSTPVKERLTPSEVIEVKEFMKRNNITSLSDLGAILTKTFKPNGQFSISVQRAVESGLYSQQEAQELTSAEVLNFVDKIQSHLSKEDFSVEPESNKVYFKDATSKTLLGTYRKASEKEVDETLFRDLASGMSLEEAVNNSPFPQLTDKFNQSKAFREELQSKVAGLKSVPVAYVIGDQLSNEDNSYYTTIKNTIRTDISPAQVDAEIDYIFSIDDDVWRSMQPQIKSILSEIESDLSKVGIDVIGLQDLSGDRIAVLNMLDRVSDVVKNPSDTNISALATLMRDTFGANPTMSLEAVDDVYKGLKVVKVVSDRADSELFENFGLIKISNDGLYHRVKRGNMSEMYDMLYNMVKEGQVNINIQSDINNKPAVLAELSAFVNARNTGMDFYSEELSLNQVIFGHKPIYSESKTQTLSRLSEITTDPVYLKTDFVSDFYNYILAEKLKNSEVYRSILSKFSITDRDITLSNTVDSIDGIKFEKELKDYIRLKKDESMNYLLPPTTGVVSEDMLYMNFPQEAQPFTTETSVQGPFVVTKDASAGYKRLDGKLYKKVASSGSRSVYTEVTPNTNPVYFSLDTAVEYDIQNAQRLLDDYNLDGIETQTLPDTTPTLRPAQLQRRNITQLLTNFLSRRGFNISVSTASQMQEELQKRGYKDFQVDVTTREEERTAIKKAAKANGTWLKTPNGKDTNLSEDQWITVRTQSFKNWFGDWESASNDFVNGETTSIYQALSRRDASHVVDPSTLEPLVMYHGSPALDIEEFDRTKSKRKSSGLRETANYFTSNKDLADFYAKAPISEEYESEIKNRIEELTKLRDEARNSRDFEAYDEGITQLKTLREGIGRTYPTFLNVRYPLRGDGQGLDQRGWSKLRLDIGYKTASTRWDILDALTGNNSAYTNVLYDGAVVDNIADMSYGTSDEAVTKENVQKYLGTVVAVWNPTQIKSATDNSGDFNPNDARIQFLKDSDMKVYGFYDKAEDKIYLAEDVLNENTLMHELWHMYKPAVKKAAEVGDDTAKVILDKMEAIANEALPMDFLNKKYDDFAGKNNALDFSGGVDFQAGTGNRDQMYSNVNLAFSNLKDKNVKNTQGWIKALTDVQKNGGVKNVNQELEWIGLEDFLNEYVKENNPKNGNIPASVVEEFIFANQIDIVDISKGGYNTIMYIDPELQSLFKEYEDNRRRKMELEEDFFEKYGEDYRNSGNQDTEEYQNIKTILTRNKEIKRAFEAKGQNIYSYNPSDNIVLPGDKEVKYQMYQLEGGKNYREVLLTMPNTIPNLLEYNDVVMQEKSLLDSIGNYIPTESQREMLREISDEKNALLATLPMSKLETVNGTDLLRAKAAEYRSSHWDEANILAHIRMNEKTLPDGRKVLIVNEIQSDWAQQGRRAGFVSKEITAQREALRLKIQEQENEIARKEQQQRDLKPLSKEESSDIERQIGKLKSSLENVRNIRDYEAIEGQIQELTAKLYAYDDAVRNLKEEIFDLKYTGPTSVSELRNDLFEFDKNNPNIGVEDMPYKGTDQWVGLATRKVFQIAVKEGYDGVAFATGQQSADMYSLSKQVDSVEVSKSSSDLYKYNVTLFKDGKELDTKGVKDDAQLEITLGKELAKKIVEDSDKIAEASSFGGGVKYEGEDLAVGGEGMKTFYDKILPKVVQKEAQRFDKGIKIETIDLSTDDVKERSSLSLGVQPYLALTKEIKESVATGIPMFQQGISPKADLTAEAYAPQPGESREVYISRMREEVEANILGKNAEEYFERMAKETGITEEQTKTFLSKVLDFVRQFSSWLANQLGFRVLSPQQASELTTKDMLDRITTTILKDEYGKNVDNLQHILNSNLESLPLYTEKDNVQDKMNACG